MRTASPTIPRMGLPDAATTVQEPAVRRILLLFAHPALQRSRVNRVLARAARDTAGITFHDLYEAYPDFAIDVPREQELLLGHEVLVLHHPMFWYSVPALLKEWQDLVLEHGWAYGRRGTALRGKTALTVVTTGGPESTYTPDGHGRTVREFLAPVEQTARLCGMRYLAPFVVHGTHAMTPERLAAHAADYARLLSALRDARVDLERASATDLPSVNPALDDVIARGA